MNFRASGTLVSQISVSSGAVCEAAARAIKERLGKMPLQPTGVDVECGARDESASLRFGAVSKDDLLGGSMTVSARTPLLCRSTVLNITKEKLKELNVPHYSVARDCSQSS